MANKKDNKVLLFGQDVVSSLQQIEDIYEAVATTYGPRGKNVLIERTYGRPTLTRDGVTVAREVYFSQRAKNMATQLICEASQTTNRVAGDGTTATIVLTRNLIREGLKLVAAGHDPMQIRDTLNQDSAKLLDAISAISEPVAEGQLVQVATVSSGDPLLGQLIAEAVETVGESGGIITEKAHISGVEREYVNGYYLQSGFTAITEGRREMEDVLVIVTAKRLSSHIDALEILQKIAQAYPQQKLRLAFVGEIEGDAYKTIVANIAKGMIDAAIIDTPSTGDMGVQYLEDIAIYTRARMLAEGDNIQSFDAAYVGHADRVICTQSTTTIFSDSAIQEDMDTRLAQLRQRLETEESEFLAEKIRDRIAKLEGKIALFRIGGATETEKEEKEYRIEDAIQASRAAYSHGVVPGGGTTLLRLSTEGVSELTMGALIATFKRLVENAGIESGVAVQSVLAAPAPRGINLRTSGDGLVDLVQEGVLDPTLVVEQIITNAMSSAGNALTIGAMVVFEDKDA